MLDSHIRHLTRYFLVLAMIAFALYWMHIQDAIAFALMGPPIYIAYWIYETLGAYAPLPKTVHFLNLAFVLPVTLVYFGFIGFQIKQLWNEHGPVRFLTVTALLTFLIYIHFIAQQNLTDYLLPLE
jgi:hypothetical protein